MTESEIIQNLKQGNEQAFKELVENYQRMVINTCNGMVHNTEDAEDIAQDVFIEVFRSVGTFRGEAKLSTWLYRIAVTRSLNFIRDNKKRKWFQSFEDSVKGKNENLKKAFAHSETPSETMENMQRANMLNAAIDSLPENQRVAFTLSKYEDLSYKEISEIMDLTVASVESLMHRAKLNLQKKLHSCYKKMCI